MDGNVCKLQILYNSLWSEHAEKADIQVFLVECKGLVFAAQSHAGDGMSLSVKGAVKQVAASAYRFPRCLGKRNVFS